MSLMINFIRTKIKKCIPLPLPVITGNERGNAFLFLLKQLTSRVKNQVELSIAPFPFQ